MQEGAQLVQQRLLMMVEGGDGDIGLVQHFFEIGAFGFGPRRIAHWSPPGLLFTASL